MNPVVETQQIEFTGNALSTLREVAKRTYRSEEAVIKLALGLYIHCLEITKGGGRILIQDPDGQIKKAISIP